MIISDERGRYRSEKTLKEKIEYLNNIWSSMTAEERHLSGSLIEELDMLSSCSDDGFDSLDEIVQMSPIFQEISSRHYDGPLVSAMDFFSDSYYLGHVWDSLFPTWRKDLDELYDNDYTEVIITGSIGGGKTMFCSLGIAMDFYQLCMLSNPQSTFGLMPGTEIVLICFNRDKKLAKDVTYGGVKNLIAASPFFKSLGVKTGPSETVYPEKNIKIIAASVRSSDALGRNIFGGLIDETDFLQGSSLVGDGLGKAGKKTFAEALHDSILRRMKSRYARFGTLPGKLFMSSSARHKASFTNQRIGKCRNNPDVFVRDYALYEAQPADRFSKNRFWVLVGNERIKHRILSDEEYDALDKKNIVELKERGCRFLHVPEDFRSDFESDIEKSVQDIGGVVTPSLTRYIQLGDRIHDAVDPTIKHPMNAESWQTDFPPHIRWDELVVRKRRRVMPGRYEDSLEPIRDPQAPRHVHIDLSRGASDPAGLCIAHIADMVEVERRGADGNVSIEEAPLIEVDFMLQIVAPRDGEIDFGAIRALIYDFMNHGYFVKYASCDSWQSTDMLQKLSQQGMTTSIVSTWKTTIPYDFTKTSLYEGRLVLYDYPIVIAELEALEKDEVKQKIDHPQGGSKDVADALAGVVYTLSRETSGNSSFSVGISEYEDKDRNTEWVRSMMQKKGDKAPVSVDDVKTDRNEGGPLFFIG